MNSLKRSILILISVLLLVSFMISAIPKEFYSKIFTGNNLIDSLIGAIIGSISAGNPINSYIVGGELLSQGIGLIAVTAFILTWVTVGIVQLPAESLMLGKKFAIYRNILSFITAIVVSILTVLILQLF
ncbi:hypothetical protein J7J83_02795 [bacterium]|nr:hypothetical protein [bacterium]